ncbi:MAG: hypothetical protein ABJA82_01590 [Myxococcales bacterium]
MCLPIIRLAVATACLLALTPAVASEPSAPAQPPPAPASTSASAFPRTTADGEASSVQDAPAVAEAQLRFRRGITLYKEGDLSGALTEMRSAYELAPTFKILYNLAQISCERGDHHAGLRYFTRYLADGADEVPTERRQEVRQEIARLRRLVMATGGRTKEDSQASGETAPEPASQVKQPPDLRTPVEPLPRERRHRAPPFELKLPTAPPSDDGGQRSRGRGPWITWSMVAACAAGAAITGVMALTASMDLQHTLDSFPASSREVDGLRDREHRLALATDALALGSAVALVAALYVTFSDRGPAQGTKTDRLAFLTF